MRAYAWYAGMHAQSERGTIIVPAGPAVGVQGEDGAVGGWLERRRLELGRNGMAPGGFYTVAWIADGDKG